MTTRRLLVAALVGVISYLALAGLARRHTPAATWGVRLDRDLAVGRAREVARDFGIDASAWQAHADAEYIPRADRYSETHDAAAARRARFSPLLYKVLLTEPGGTGSRVLVTLIADGRAVMFGRREQAADGSAAPTEDTNRTAQSGGFRVQVNTGDEAKPDEPSGSGGETIDERARPAADLALSRLLGDADEMRSYVFVSAKPDKLRGRQGASLRYERQSAETPELKMIATCFVADGEALDVAVVPETAPEFERAYASRTDATQGLRGIGAFLIALAVLALPPLYFRALLRGQVRHRLSLVLFALVFLGAIAASIASNSIGASFVERGLENNRGEVAEAAVETLVPGFFYALGFALVWSVGFVFARRAMPLRVASFVALLRGRVTRRYVGASLASGVLLGGALAVAGFLLAASGVAPGFEVPRTSAKIFVASSPIAATLLESLGFELFVLYAFLVPAMDRVAGVRRFAPLVAAACGTLLLMDVASRLSTPWSTFLHACLLILIAEQIFRRYDLLALVTAVAASSAASSAAALVALDQPVLRRAGWLSFAVLAALAAAGALVHFAGNPARIENEIEPDPSDESAGTRRAERERLRAEFGVARRAQERMLPESAPRVPGYEIAASCRPAREVGGDLYDFLRLPDERIGIVVADVSGKGVPAALYMTLTKGLLASVAQVESDPRRMLCEVNRHLYEVCRRKMFVTLILGVLDPATGELTLARAGHNPTVWRRAAKGEVRSLRAPGLGLGLNKGALFNSTLKTETIRLERGDAVVFYSDGVTEAMNSLREEYGEDRLQQIAAQTDGMTAKATEEAILADVHGFLGDEAPQDDVTVVVLRVSEDRGQI